jgi:hypothetical protein
MCRASDEVVSCEHEDKWQDEMGVVTKKRSGGQGERKVKRRIVLGVV